MKWWKLIEEYPRPVKTTIIPVQQLGFEKFVYVRTKRNGGIK